MQPVRRVCFPQSLSLLLRLFLETKRKGSPSASPYLSVYLSVFLTPLLSHALLVSLSLFYNMLNTTGPFKSFHWPISSQSLSKSLCWREGLSLKFHKIHIELNFAFPTLTCAYLGALSLEAYMSSNGGWQGKKCWGCCSISLFSSVCKPCVLQPC